MRKTIPALTRRSDNAVQIGKVLKKIGKTYTSSIAKIQSLRGTTVRGFSGRKFRWTEEAENEAQEAGVEPMELLWNRLSDIVGYYCSQKAFGMLTQARGSEVRDEVVSALDKAESYLQGVHTMAGVAMAGKDRLLLKRTVGNVIELRKRVRATLADAVSKEQRGKVDLDANIERHLMLGFAVTFRTWTNLSLDNQTALIVEISDHFGITGSPTKFSGVRRFLGRDRFDPAHRDIIIEATKYRDS